MVIKGSELGNKIDKDDRMENRQSFRLTLFEIQWNPLKPATLRCYVKWLAVLTGISQVMTGWIIIYFR